MTSARPREEAGSPACLSKQSQLGRFCLHCHGLAGFRARHASFHAVHHHGVILRHRLARRGAHPAHLLAHHAHFGRHHRIPHHEVRTHLTHLRAIHHHFHGVGVAIAHLHTLHHHFGARPMAVHTGLNTCLHFSGHVSHTSYLTSPQKLNQAQIIDLIRLISYRDYGIWTQR